MAEPVVSILIPCHNAAPWLAETLESALAQSWPHKEIIVVDDGSTDSSPPILRDYAARGICAITQANAGASAARNRALAAARGDYIQFLDADDLLAPDKIARQLQLAGTLDADFALCCTWTRFRRSIADADRTPEPLCTDATPVDWLVEKFEHHRMMHPAAWLVSRSLAEKAGPWDETLSLDDDGEYFTRVVLASRGVRCCREAVSFYRSQLSSSLSGTKSDRAWSSAWRSLELSTDRLLTAENSARTRRACATAMQRYIYEAYPSAPGCRVRAEVRIAEFGGSTLAPEGGPKFQLARRLLGWRLAKRLQRG